MKIKNWKKVRDTGRNIIYMNMLPQYKSFHDNYYIHLFQFDDGSWSGQLNTPDGKGHSMSTYPKKYMMIQEAVGYMKRNPVWS